MTSVEIGPEVSWRDYQELVAEVFRAFGFIVSVEEVLRGARSAHAIDVVVRFHSHGLNHLWICECKRWSRPVPQEKIDSLASVVEDVGAHHGLCFSEAGFQAGAHRVASNRNITLTSLSEFRAASNEELLKAELGAYAGRAARLADVLDSWVEATFPEMQTRIEFLFGACPIGSIGVALRSLVDTISRTFTVGYPQHVGTIEECDEENRVFASLWGKYYTLASVNAVSPRDLISTAASLLGIADSVIVDLTAGRIPHPQ